MMGAEQLAQMKKGGRLLNLSRGNVVDIPALADALRSGQVSGAAVDVFPSEPQSNQERFESPLQGLAQRDPDAARGRLHRGGSGRHRQRGRYDPAQVPEHRQHVVCGQLPEGRAADLCGVATASSTSTATCPAC